MKMGFAGSVGGIEHSRRAFDYLTGAVARVFTLDDSPYRPGENFDAQLRYADYGGNPDVFIVREFDRGEGIATTTELVVHLERIHLY